MAVGISSAGTMVYYAVETVSDERPTSGWKEIPDLVSTPEQNDEPNQLDYTPLSEKNQHLTIPGLRPAPSNAAYTANLNDSFMDAWDALCDAHDTAQESNLNVWFCTVIPNLKRCMYQQVTPTRLGSPGLEVDSVIQMNAYISANSSPEWSTEKPTLM